MSKIRRYFGGENACLRRGRQDHGYVLISMLFIMVSFLSVVFLLFCPLIKEKREDSGFYIIDRNDYRFRKALFGEAVDQCATKLAHCGGFYSDYDDAGRTGSAGQGKSSYMYQSMVIARTFGTLGWDAEVEIPKEYHFTGDHFWTGYWGKRYLHILPADKWDYDTFYEDLPGPTTAIGHDPFNRQPYAGTYLSSLCGASQNTMAYKNFAKKTFFGFTVAEEVIIQVKDYSEGRIDHQLRLVTIGSKNHPGGIFPGNMFFETLTFSNGHGYILYTFRQDRTQGGGTAAEGTGQKKLIIQIKNSDDSWITRDTRLISLPPDVGTGGRVIFMVNFYG